MCSRQSGTRGDTRGGDESGAGLGWAGLYDLGSWGGMAWHVVRGQERGGEARVLCDVCVGCEGLGVVVGG